jgi:hypothetical protein
MTDLSRRKALADAVAGVIGSVVSLWTFYPIEVLKTNLQAGSSGKRRGSMFQGCQSKTLHTTSSSFCYFFLYSYIFAYWKRQNNNRNAEVKTSTRLVLTAIAAMLNTAVTLPLDVISLKHVTSAEKEVQKCSEEDYEKMERAWCETRYSSDEDSSFDDSATEYHDTESGFEEEKKEEGLLYDARYGISGSLPIVSSLDEQGFGDLWKGLAPALLLCTNPSINYTIFDVAKTRLMKIRKHSDSSLSMSEAFLLGLFAKFVATIATYPLIRAKIIMMVTSEKSLIATLCRTYREEGVRGLFKGCDWQLLHTVLKSALMMMVREKITHRTHRLIVGETTTR